MLNSTLLFLSGPDLLIIALLVLLLFGGRKIPEFARGLGQSMRHFKEGSEGNKDDAAKKEAK